VERNIVVARAESNGECIQTSDGDVSLPDSPSCCGVGGRLAGLSMPDVRLEPSSRERRSGIRIKPARGARHLWVDHSKTGRSVFLRTTGLSGPDPSRARHVTRVPRGVPAPRSSREPRLSCSKPSFEPLIGSSKSARPPARTRQNHALGVFAHHTCRTRELDEARLQITIHGARSNEAKQRMIDR
jgi:hypothetical protein